MKNAVKKSLAASLIGVSVLLMSSFAWSGVAVIVHPSNSSTLDKSDIARLFLGKKKSFPNGSEAIPVDQEEGSPIRVSFANTVLNKNEQQVKAYWAQLLFTGKGTPPKTASDDSSVKKLVAENPAVIGYIDSGQVDDTVRVVYEY